MRKIDYTKAIKESLSELETTYKSLSNTKAQERCEVLIWLKKGEIKTMKKAIELKNKSSSQGQRWWNQYKQEGLSGFLSLKYTPQESPLKDKTELDDRLEAEGFSTIKEAKLWIYQTYKLSYTENGLGNYFRANKIKLKTGRPNHPKKDEEKRAEYKKNMKKN